MRNFLIACGMVLAVMLVPAKPAAYAQGALDNSFMQRVVAAIQLQRNQAQDAAAAQQARAEAFEMQVDQAQARVKELEAKLAEVQSQLKAAPIPPEPPR